MSAFVYFLLARVSILVVFAYAAGRIPPCRRVLRQPLCLEDHIFRGIYFAALVVLEAAITPRSASDFMAPLAAITGAGLIAGPATGIITGLIGLLMTNVWGGGWAVGIAMVLTGGVVGAAGRWRPALSENAVAGMFTGAAAEIAWATFAIALQLTAGHPTAIVSYAVTPVLVNAVQVAFFVAIISDIRAGQNRVDRAEMLRALTMARSSLSHGKGWGLDEDTAANIVALVRSVTGIPGVEIFARNQSLAASKPIILPSDELIQAPLLYAGREVGYISVYDPGKRRIDSQVLQLAVELAQFVVEYHLRLRELQEQTEAVSRTELKALQAQVHPHFLFNALNTLAALCHIDAKQANRLTVRLGEFLRSSLQATAQDVVSLERELSVVRSYLEIEKARFQEMLVIEERIDADTEEVFIPPFALQTLVENSIVHGIANKVSQGHLTLVARTKGDRLVFMVIDDGEPAEGVASDKRRPGPHGLDILEARLKNIYGNAAGLRLRKRSGGGMIALLWISTGRISN